MFFALGAMVGPLIASAVMDRFGPTAFFVYTGGLHLAFVAFVGLRLFVRGAARPATAAASSGFCGLPRRSFAWQAVRRGRTSPTGSDFSAAPAWKAGLGARQCGLSPL